MPRRPATIERDIPLFILPHSTMRGVRTHGEDLERAIVRTIRSHFSRISIRTRLVRRERKRAKKDSSGTPEADSREEGEHSGERV